MKLKFTWTPGPAGPMAVCTADVLDSNGVSPLSCLLMDDGGIDRAASLVWLREGISRVDIALAGGVKGRGDWDREDWGAAVTQLETNVHSLHDERCSERIATPKFRRALAEWTNFVEAGSNWNAVVVDLS